MLTGVTQTDTRHGNPCEFRELPAGILVKLIPATNLPPDSAIKFWAHPLPDNPWPTDTAAWAESVGVGLEADDVAWIRDEDYCMECREENHDTCSMTAGCPCCETSKP
ncbi:hypothetical protein LCGC14_1377890 [marine sediment metagenome]|uniref:Uncharacterized protein n=1 Tax=marine sediment metagenome TaxID=412755 RepID=A0A0F9MIV6_9ZZZZ